jgi:HD superfamily phosphodiesterase
MSIPNKFKYRSVYHFTHLDNLPGILEHGLLSTSEGNCLGIEYNSVALSDIQRRRALMPVTCGNGGVVHDYVPLYFCKRSSMLLYLVHNKIVDQQFVIYFEFPILIIDDYPYAFCDAAANTEIHPNFYCDSKELDNLNWDAIDELKWAMGTERLKQKRMAELLIHRRIDKDSISRIIVWNDSIKKYVLECYGEAGLKTPPIVFEPIHYFTDFYGSGRHSIVTGPYFIKKAYKETVDFILQNNSKSSNPKFNKLKDFRDALRANLGCIPETAEIVGLESDNEMHSEDVGTHTIKVVEELRKLPDYKDMNPTDKLLVEIAAYLHDIGKGPKSRWASNKGKQKVDPDHPIKALPMLKRILAEDIGSMMRRSAKVICKLVCYHDIVGDIVGKGRRVEELGKIVEDERELDMIIALGKADMMSVNPAWGFMYDQKVSKLRETVIAKLESSE